LGAGDLIVAVTCINLKFADGEYRFALPLEQIRELQDKTGAGIGELYGRVLKGRLADQVDIGHPAFAAFRVDDVRETIRLGLVGGGEGMVDGADVKVSALRANDLISRYVDAMPLKEQWDLAAAILYAKVEGYTDPDETEAPAPAPAEDKKKADGSTTPAP